MFCICGPVKVGAKWNNSLRNWNIMSPFYIRFISLSCFYHSFLSIIFFWIPALCSAFLFVCVVFVHLPKYIYTNVFLFHVKKIIRELDKFSLKLCCMFFGPLFILLGNEFIIIYGSSVDVLSVAVKICLPTNIRSHYGWHFSSAIYLLLPCLMSIYFLKCDFSHSVNLPCESKSTQLIFSSSVRSFLIYIKNVWFFFVDFHLHVLNWDMQLGNVDDAFQIQMKKNSQHYSSSTHSRYCSPYHASHYIQQMAIYCNDFVGFHRFNGKSLWHEQSQHLMIAANFYQITAWSFRPNVSIDWSINECSELHDMTVNKNTVHKLISILPGARHQSELHTTARQQA